MSELIGFPMISQLDGDRNQDADCVPASIAACIQWLTGHPYTAKEIKGAVYGVNYTGGTAASAYVDYCAARGVRLAPINGNGAALVSDLHAALAAQHPCLITEPSPYGAGWTHVCAAYKDTASSITVMDPWIDKPVTKNDSEWAAQLQFNQIWTLEATMGIPIGWHDDGTTLSAPNGVPVVRGFRDYILNHMWDAANWPLAPEAGRQPLENGNTALGGGTFQIFRMTMLEWTQDRGVFVSWIGQELSKTRQELAALKAQQPAPAPTIDTSAVEADIHAIADAIATPVAKALADLKKL